MESDPIGFAASLNTYAYVGGSPIGHVDQLGLATADQVNAATQALMQNFPDIFGSGPNSVAGSSLGPGQAGHTDLSGNILYNSDLYGADGVPVSDGQLDNFLQTMAHEMQHLSESPLDRIGLNVGSVLNALIGSGSIEDIIDHNADIMYRQTIDQYRRRVCK